ncbi:MAG TPA: hypothetical protein VNM22_21050 [Candidatus Limnocylindrales bacterium]|nr:hypothetical protein [Candidatus Limnocylindrales bacterium]
MSHSTVFLITYLILLLLIPLSGGAATPEMISLPIRKVVLYKHGVGYFEHQGKVRDNQVISLRFKAGQMNDMLKSLVVLDLGQGNISEIAFDSKKPLDKLLDDFSVNLSGEANLITLLGQIKGARVEVQVGAEGISGFILGLETKTFIQDSHEVHTRLLNIMKENGELVRFNLDDIKGIQVLDESLRRDVQDYLTTLLAYRKKDIRMVTISTNGTGEREVMLGYTVEVPVWKTSYRMVLEENKKPLLQGWAIVDNIQDEDWEEVELSLVSGLPVSFIQDLYTPRYKRRPVVQVEEELAIAPQVAEAPLEEGPAEEKAAETRTLESLPGAIEGKMAPTPAPPPTSMPKREMLAKARTAETSKPSLATGLAQAQPLQTITQEVGDLFEYRIDHPVTIKRNRSALLPIVQREMDGEKIVLYNEGVRAENPLRALRITNTTGLTLEGGPVTVIDENTYAGEALLGTLKPNEKSFISYAVDLGSLVNTAHESKRDRVFLVKIINGNLSIHYKQVESKTYTVRNKEEKTKVLYIEHPYRSDWTLADNSNLVETTPNFYRFRVELKPNATTKFDVREENSFADTYVLTDLTEENITIFANQKYFTPEVEQTIHQIIRLKGQIGDMDKQIKEKEDQVTTIFKDQERVRENLKTLKDTPEQRKLLERYTAKLSAGEDQLEQLRKEIQALKAQRLQLSQELSKILQGLSFEKQL